MKEPPKPPVIVSERPWHAHARWQIVASVRGIERLPKLSAELRWRGAEVQVPQILEEAVTGAEKAESSRRIGQPRFRAHVVDLERAGVR